MLVDGSPIAGLTAVHTGQVVNRSVSELVVIAIPIEIARQLAVGTKVEARLCNTEFEIPQQDRAALTVILRQSAE